MRIILPKLRDADLHPTHGVPLADRMNLLRQVPAFSPLPADILESLAESADEETYWDGDVVVTEGEQGDRLFVVVRGEAEATTARTGGSVLLAGYTRGEMFGELALLSEDRRRQATVTATTDLLLLSLSARPFAQILERFPEVRRELTESRRSMLVAKFLKQASPFARIDADVVRLIAERVGEQAAGPGEEIICQGDLGDTCYFVRSGRVEVVAAEPGQTPRRLATLGPGALFGETALLMEAPRNATVRALEPTGLLTLRRHDLLEVMGDDQRVAAQVLELVQLRERPLQRTGVIAQQRLTRDGEHITVLKDPSRGAYYQLSLEGWFIWQRLDGRRTLRDLTLDYLDEFKSFSPDAVAGVVGGLAAAGFLQNKPVPRTVEDATKHVSLVERARRLMREMKEFQPAVSHVDQPLGRLYRGGIWILYTIPAQIVLALLAVAGLIAFFHDTRHAWDLLTHRHRILLFLFVPLYALAFLIHEAAHAFTVKAFGYEIPKIGITWYAFAPMAYIDTSDMWLADRWKRIAVSAAGPYSTLAVAGIASVAATFTNSHILDTVLWQLASTCYLSVLINLNPLLEYDGYFILMDWVDRPNLRAHCMRWLALELPGAVRHRTELWRHRRELLFGAAVLIYSAVMAAIVLFIYRLVLQGRMHDIVPDRLTDTGTWILIVLVILAQGFKIAKEVRAARLSAVESLA